MSLKTIQLSRRKPIRIDGAGLAIPVPGVKGEDLARSSRSVSPEERVIAALETQFPGSVWATGLPTAPDQNPPPKEACSHADNTYDTDLGTGSRVADILSVIGGKVYVSKDLIRWVYELPPDTVVATGDGQGSEKMLRRLLDRRQMYHIVPEKEFQVGRILDAGNGAVITVGSGARVDKVKAWHKRAKWGRELLSVGVPEAKKKSRARSKAQKEARAHGG